MTKPIKVVINGFGRIGRTILRQILTISENRDIEVVAINDIAAIETCAYLFRYDSVFGPFPEPVCHGKGRLQVGDRDIPFWCHEDLRAADLDHVDVVLECTGRATTRDVAEAGLSAGASSVLISGPSDAADKTIVLGANEQKLGDARIVSNASCTTNAIAPLLKIIDLGLGIDRAHVTTIHCYTGSQPTVDIPGTSLERSRAAAVSMVPTTTSAADQVFRVLPEFQGRLSVAALRVPSISVSAIDATIQVSEAPDQRLDVFVKEAFADNPIIGMTDDPCVSIDMRARAESLIIGLTETMISGQKQFRLFGWYDNEWGFSARMIDMTRRLSGRGNKEK